MAKKPALTAEEKVARRRSAKNHFRRYWVLYAMMVVPVIYYIVFKYLPMFGSVLAFRRYRPGMGPFGTEWTLRYWERFLKDPAFWSALRNTVITSVSNLVINFPIPIILRSCSTRCARRSSKRWYRPFRTCRALSRRLL